MIGGVNDVTAGLASIYNANARALAESLGRIASGKSSGAPGKKSQGFRKDSQTFRKKSQTIRRESQTFAQSRGHSGKIRRALVKSRRPSGTVAELPERFADIRAGVTDLPARVGITPKKWAV